MLAADANHLIRVTMGGLTKQADRPIETAQTAPMHEGLCFFAPM